jgi:hypothetical protein
MTETPETNQCVKDNKHIKFLEEDHWSLNGKFTYTHPIVALCRRLERERDDAIRSCHIWQKGHSELVAERDKYWDQADYFLDQLGNTQIRMYDAEIKLEKITEALEYVLGIGLTAKTKAKADKALNNSKQ